MLPNRPPNSPGSKRSNGADLNYPTCRSCNTLDLPCRLPAGRQGWKILVLDILILSLYYFDNMDKTVLQVPVSKALRTQAENAALDYGFSSLQEIVRVFMNKLAKKTIDISFQEVIKLSPKAEKRLEKMDEDFSIGENVYLVKSVEKLKKQLAK